MRTDAQAAAAVGGPQGAASGAGPVTATGSSAESKRQRVLEFIQRNRNANTRRTYESGWRGFAKYLFEISRPVDQVAEEDVADYLRIRVEEQQVAFSTLKSDVSAIADHLKHGPRAGLTAGQLVADMMGVLRTMAASSRPKQHIEKELMRQILRAHDERGKRDWRTDRDACLMLLMMMGMLRQSEAVQLRVSDVQIEQRQVDGCAAVRVLSIFIAKSKTDQAQDGAVVLLGENAQEPGECPLARLERWLVARAAAGIAGDALFPKKCGQPLANTTPCSIVKDAVREANERAAASGRGSEYWGDHQLYGSHSLRRGGVTAARANGVSMLDIQRHGRWKSLTVFAYVGRTVQEQIAVSQRFLQAFSGSGATTHAAGDAQLIVPGAALMQQAGTEAKTAVRVSSEPEAAAGAAAAAGLAGVAPAAAPVTVKKAKKPRAPRSAPAKAAEPPQVPKAPTSRKRRAHSDDEEPTEQEQQQEAMDDAIFCAELNQGFNESAAESDTEEAAAAVRVQQPNRRQASLNGERKRRQF